jgi:hypothetical protein
MIPYIIYAGLLLAGCLSFYKILLQKETFFRLNRYVLLACILLSFAVPFIPVPENISFRKTSAPEVTQSIEPGVLPVNTIVQKAEPVNTSSDNSIVSESKPAASPAFSTGKIVGWLFWIYWFGVAAFGINFLVQLVHLLYRSYSSPVIRDGRFRIVEISGDKAPCSFGNSIFINPEKYDWETYNQILLHEKLHITQGHSFDIMIAEIVLVFQWFNPFAWIYRKEMENNLEFLTDHELLENASVEKSSYQMSLLKVSAPHFPLSLTTNYNQSLLKKRFVMMNAKKSNIHTTWKYFFLLPLLLTFACFFNEPFASAQEKSENKNIASSKKNNGIDTEGAWFAVIKDDKISMQFRSFEDSDKNSYNSNTFLRSDFTNLPMGQSGSFSLTREAGTMNFTGKFEGTEGMGRYKFEPSKTFAADMKKEGVEDIDDEDLMAYFFINVTKAYVQMLKANGYSGFSKNDLLPLVALNIDETYIRSVKQSFPSADLQNMIPLKALGVDAAYIKEIKDAGYKNVTIDQLVSFKAQHIDGKFIADTRAALAKEGKALPDSDELYREEKDRSRKKADKEKTDKKSDMDKKNSDEDDEINDLVAIKAMNVDAAFINSMKAVGYENLRSRDLVTLKALDIDAAFVTNLRTVGYNNLPVSTLAGLKSQGVTPEYIRSFESVGFGKPKASDIVGLKAMGITAGYVKSFQDAGFKNISLSDATALKSQNITPALIKEYQSFGFEKVTASDVISAKVMGVTPSFIKSMQEKGHKLSSIQKYVQLKIAVD